MCTCERNGRLGRKVIATVAGFIGITGVFAAAVPPEARADVVRNPNVRHYFRQTVIPRADTGRARIGLWVLNPVSGRLRLCLLGDPAADNKDFLKCSPWQRGSDSPGRYNLIDIQRRLPYPFRGTPGAARLKVIGVWVLDYLTGAVRACVVTDLANPTGSLACAAAP